MQQKTKIAVIPGDGIGKEVIREGVLLLNALIRKFDLNFTLEEKPWGADMWLKTQVGLPSDAIKELSDEYCAIYFGALGDERIPDMAHGREILLGLRQGLDLYANIRPAKLYHSSLGVLKNEPAIDFVVIRENTEGLYVNAGGNFKKDTPDEVTVDERIFTRKGVDRIVSFAFDFAKRSKRRSVMLVDKSNAFQIGGGLWQRVFKEVGKLYPEIEQKHRYVDVAAMEMVLKPEEFDVVVTSNLFGDILSDLAAGLVGGLGIPPSANINPNIFGLFEPVHGSAPKIAGKNIANPFSAFLTASMLFEFVSNKQVVEHVEKAIRLAINESCVTPDLDGTASTDQVGQFVRESVLDSLKRV